MRKEESDIQKIQDLTEKCRIALERSYGFKIPMPNVSTKHARLNKLFGGA